MDRTSEIYLSNVHPQLRMVIEYTSQTPQAFVVVYGIRTVMEEKKMVEEGKSQTMHSRHLPNKDGFACACDVAAYTNGQVDWAKGREEEVYGQIWRQIKTSADLLDIPVEWGGNWHTLKDYGHIQLPWEAYP